MTDNDISKLLPDWTLSYLISQRGNEKIFRAEKETSSGTQYTLIKAVFIPCFDEKFEELKKEKTQEELVKLNNEMLRECKNEITFIRGMCYKGNWLNLRESYDLSNANSTQTLVVSRYDHAQPIDEFIKENGLTQGALVKLGIDVCCALEQAKKHYNTVHGSLTPEIIYLDDNCRFRLGKMDTQPKEEKERASLSARALEFCAPETDGEMLDTQSDIYSIGLIMYYYLNDCRLPFEDELSKEEALKKRLSGAPFPAPSHDIAQITPIVMKACSSDKNERYASPYRLKKALEESYFRFQKEIEEKKIKERARLKKLESQNQSDEEAEKNKDISAHRVVEVRLDEKKKNNFSKRSIKRVLSAFVAVVLITVTAFFGIKIIKNERSKDLSRYKINLASVYYKETERAQEFAFSYNYNGEPKEPKVIIGDLENLIEGEDYEVEYTDNIEVGEATITVKGIGEYKGTKSRTFYIKPEKPKEIAQLQTAEVGSDYAVLSWSESEKAEKYLIYRYDYETGEWSDFEYALDCSQTSIKITGLKANTLYKFSVKGAIAYNGGKLETGSGKSVEFKTKS